jgi:hypothetical protein
MRQRRRSLHDAVAFRALLLIKLMISVLTAENAKVADVRTVIAHGSRHHQ